MLKSKTSAYISLAVCGVSSVLLVLLTVAFPRFIRWLYFGYKMMHLQSAAAEHILSTITPAYYICVPFAVAALYALIRLLLNVVREQIFVQRNVLYLRLVSWCCYAVAAVTLGFGFSYFPLMFVALMMGIVGTLLRVVKNIMQSAVELREENDLTI
ncbi:MAG: DUF2975 domain-containing protein [Clostridia bacterium]|nr:DUF2975 domain-containing protein [Clostridia bacterium]